MSIDSIDRENIRTNTEALNHALNVSSFDLFGAKENQANRIFRNLDQFQQRGGNDLPQAIEEYRKDFNQINKTRKADHLPELELVDYDKDGDMDIQLVKDNKVVKIYKHQ